MSNLIPRDFIDHLLARADIVELIDNRVPLKKAGKNYHACCPFHAEKTPSFTVSPVKQFYYCFGCGASGNAIGFLMAYERLDFVSAVEALAQQLGVEVPRDKTQAPGKIAATENLYSVMTAAARFYQQQLRRSQQAIDYLRQRGISGVIAKQFVLGFAPPGWDNLLQTVKQPEALRTAGLTLRKEQGHSDYDRFRERIMFPIRDRRGRVVGFGGRVLDNSLPKYLNSPETTIFHKSHVLYGLYEARQAQAELTQLMVVEGYMDVIALAQAGIPFAVATLGTSITTPHVELLFKNTSTVIFCFDGDRAGQTAAWRALQITLPVLQDGYSAKFLWLPEGEDPDTLVRKEGREAFMSRLETAQTLPAFFFAQLKTQVNPHDMAGRARFTQLAMSYIDTLQHAPITRELMLDQLAALVRIEKNRLLTITHHAMPAQAATIQDKLQATPMRLTIALLLQQPALASDVTIDINALTLPGSELLKQLFLLLRDNPHLTTGAILEYWRDRPELPYLQKLAAWEHTVPEEGINAEWQGVLQHLQKLQHEHDIELLLDKASQQTITAEEKILLQKLLAERR